MAVFAADYIKGLEVTVDRIAPNSPAEVWVKHPTDQVGIRLHAVEAWELSDILRMAANIANKENE